VESDKMSTTTHSPFQNDHLHLGVTRGLLVIISGPAGSGKTVIAEEAIRRVAGMVCRATTATTRPPRPNETDGIDYFFLTREQFEEKWAAGELVERNEFNGNLYGALRSEVEKLLAQRKIVLLVIDVNGAEAIVKETDKKHQPCARIFVLPPTAAILRERLSSRGTETPRDLENRLAIAANEINRLEDYDYLVVNDELEMAVHDLLHIIDTLYSHHIRGGEIAGWRSGCYADWHDNIQYFD
jgi:guanylate kinase